MTRPVRDAERLLLGEWACLGILAAGPSHGFAIASRLRSDADLGRIWSLSRPLTYRAIDQLLKHGYAEPVGEEPGIAGGTRTILSITDSGRLALRECLARPVIHLRDLSRELLLKLQLAASLGIETSVLVDAQRASRRHRHTVATRDRRRGPAIPRLADPLTALVTPRRRPRWASA